jgi:hypothetical protein
MLILLLLFNIIRRLCEILRSTKAFARLSTEFYPGQFDFTRSYHLYFKNVLILFY